jgi:YD repeat-containing protein
MPIPTSSTSGNPVLIDRSPARDGWLDRQHTIARWWRFDTLQIGYTYDAGNRLRTAVDSGAGTITLGYDDLDRMTSESSPQGSTSEMIGTSQGNGRPASR